MQIHIYQIIDENRCDNAFSSFATLVSFVHQKSHFGPKNRGNFT